MPTASFSGPDVTADTFIRADVPDTNFDHAFSQVIIQRNQDKYLLRFDLSTMPSNAVIDSVRVALLNTDPNDEV